MYFTPLATRLLFSFGTSVKTPACILQQSRAVGAQPSIVRMMMVTTVESDHPADGFFLTFNSIHQRFVAKNERIRAAHSSPSTPEVTVHFG